MNAESQNNGTVVARSGENERQLLMPRAELQAEISSDNGEGISVSNVLSNSVDQTSSSAPGKFETTLAETRERCDDEARKNIFSVQVRGSVERLRKAKEVLRT